MAIGPGKYDALCTLVRDAAQAESAIVIVIDGNHGSGFSVQTTNLTTSARLAPLLEELARQIRFDAGT